MVSAHLQALSLRRRGTRSGRHLGHEYLLDGQLQRLLCAGFNLAGHRHWLGLDIDDAFLGNTVRTKRIVSSCCEMFGVDNKLIAVSKYRQPFLSIRMM